MNLYRLNPTYTFLKYPKTAKTNLKTCTPPKNRVKNIKSPFGPTISLNMGFPISLSEAASLDWFLNRILKSHPVTPFEMAHHKKYLNQKSS